jgi:hypothetical protein
LVPRLFLGKPPWSPERLPLASAPPPPPTRREANSRTGNALGRLQFGARADTHTSIDDKGKRFSQSTRFTGTLSRHVVQENRSRRSQSPQFSTRFFRSHKGEHEAALLRRAGGSQEVANSACPGGTTVTIKFELNLQPTLWNEIAYIVLSEPRWGKPLPWADYNFVRCFPKPSTPPAKRAICRNEVPTFLHQDQVLRRG